MKRPLKLLYQNNNASYSLLMLYIVAMTIYVLNILLNMKVSWQVSFVSLSNVLIMLFAFLIAVKVKVYDDKFRYMPFVLAAYQLLQTFLIPVGLTSSEKTTAIITSIVAIVFALLSGSISVYKNKIRRKVIKDGNISNSHFAK